MSEELVQGSDEWRLARVGSLGASRLQEAIAKTKTGYGASRANLMAELICERLTGQPAEKFVTAAMQHGTDTEPEARDAYCFYHGVTVNQVGLIRHPSIERTHASPDGLVGEDGMIEVKCPQPAAHLETLLGQEIPAKYVTQMMWQMACSGRQWVDFVSYSPSLPESMRIFREAFASQRGTNYRTGIRGRRVPSGTVRQARAARQPLRRSGGGMSDRVFAIAGDWALASDGVQWILMRQQGGQWRAKSFVRSSRNILARCMREKDVEAAHIDLLLSGLPDTFDQWKAAQPAPEWVP